MLLEHPPDDYKPRTPGWVKAWVMANTLTFLALPAAVGLAFLFFYFLYGS
jgi:hypothetical protein